VKNRAERRAVLHYRLRGYRIVGTNVWAGGNEIDVVARRGRRLVFCEVKSKSGPRFGDPIAMVDEEKIRRVRRAAEAYLAVRRDLRDCEVVFDVVTESEGRLKRVPRAF
jgi:putative endonuclease